MIPGRRVLKIFTSYTPMETFKQDLLHGTLPRQVPQQDATLEEDSKALPAFGMWLGRASAVAFE